MTSERWQKLTIFEQMGNIGSEINRAFSWRERGNGEYAKQAMDSALELFDLTISDPRWIKTGRLKEICRAREVVCDFFFGENQYNESEERLMKYFDEFALAARKDR